MAIVETIFVVVLGLIFASLGLGLDTGSMATLAMNLKMARVSSHHWTPTKTADLWSLSRPPVECVGSPNPLDLGVRQLGRHLDVHVYPDDTLFRFDGVDLHQLMAVKPF